MAIKTVPKTSIKEETYVREEIKVLQRLDHPNIVKYHGSYETERYMYVVTELCPGHELFDLVSNDAREGMPESNCKTIMRQLLLAINHCHSNGIAHRDIKPENIMISGEGDNIETIAGRVGLSAASIAQHNGLPVT